jgi:hypothetical protein
MTGLYGSLRGSDFAKREPRQDQDPAQEHGEPYPLAGERQRRCVAGGREDAWVSPGVAPLLLPCAGFEPGSEPVGCCTGVSVVVFCWSSSS